MKTHKLTSLFISLLLILSLLLSSCMLTPVPPGGPPSGQTGGGQGGGQGDAQGGGQGDAQGGSQGDSENEYIPPVIVNPPAPDFGDEEDEAFGEYSVYYLFDTEGNRFTLQQIQSNEKGEIRAAALRGTAVKDDNCYTLTYDGGEVGYGKLIGGVFYLTDENFACPEDYSTRGGDGVTEVEITPALGSSDWGYRDLANLKNGRAMQSFYRELLEACKDFASSNKNLQSNADYYKICELDFTKHGINSDQAQTVWSLFRMENPIFYWLSAVCYYTPTRFYLTADEAYSSYAARSAYDADIQAMIAEAKACLSPAMNDVERALAVHDYLLSIMDYAYIPGTSTPETAIWAHNVTGASTVGSGVCEAYAKTYQLLMQILGIPTLYVTGYAGEPHAWNLVYLSGEWVGVDVTWDDMGKGAYLTSNFGLSASALAKEHMQDAVGGVGTSYHYATPTVSPLGLSLLTLFKNGTRVGIYGSIDDAFANVTDKNGSYVLSFYNYTEHGAYNVAAPDVYYYTARTDLPLAANVRIEGEFYTSAAPYATRLHLLSSFLTVSTPLTLDGIHLTEGHSTHRGVTLSEILDFSGQVCEITLSYLGRANATDTATVRSSAALTVSSGLNLSELTLTGASPELTLMAGEMHIELLKLDGASALSLWLDPEAVNLHLYRECQSHLDLLLLGGDDAHLGADTLLILTPQNNALSFAVYTALGGGHRDCSDYFTLSEDNAIVLKQLTELSDMTVADGVLVSYHGTGSTFALPAGVHSIGACAFADYRGTEIVLPEGILYLRRGALEHSNLEYITLPTTLCTFDTALSDYTKLAPVKQYTFAGSYADWARVVAVSDFVLYYYTTPAVIVCADGTGLALNPVEKHGEDRPVRAVSNVLCEIISTGGIKGKRMHLLDYSEDGDALLITFDVYSSGAYGAPTSIARLTLTALGEGRYFFTYKGVTYYVAVTNGAFIYTNQSGEPISEYPS